MYIDPKRPKTAHQRGTRMKSQAKRIATVVYKNRRGVIMKMSDVTADMEPTTVAKTWKAGREQVRLIVLQSEIATYPFPIAVFVLSFRFVKVLRVETNDCKGKDQLQEPKDQVDDVLNREA